MYANKPPAISKNKSLIESSGVPKSPNVIRATPNSYTSHAKPIDKTNITKRITLERDRIADGKVEKLDFIV